MCISAWVCFGFALLFSCAWNRIHVITIIISPAEHNISIWSFQRWFNISKTSLCLRFSLQYLSEMKWCVKHTHCPLLRVKKIRFREIGVCFGWAKLMSSHIHRWHHCALVHCTTAPLVQVTSSIAMQSLDSFMLWIDFWRATRQNLYRHPNGQNGIKFQENFQMIYSWRILWVFMSIEIHFRPTRWLISHTIL